MKFVIELLQLGFFYPARLWSLYKAKKMHGSNACMMLHYAALVYKNKTAVADDESSLSFSGLYQQVSVLASIVKEHSANREDATIVLVCSNSIQQVLLLFAVQYAGLKLVLVNHQAHPNEINSIINTQQQPCYVFASRTINVSCNNLVQVEKLFDEIKNQSIPCNPSHIGTTVIFPTSGTTGTSKLIEKRKGFMYWFRPFTDLITYTGIHKKRSVFIAVPLSQGFGYTTLLFAVVLGKKAIVTNNREWNKKADLIIQEQAELIAGVPAALYHLAEELKNRKHNVSLIISGGAALTNLVFNSIKNTFGNNIFSMYGSTEASTSFVAGYNHLQKNIHALGRPLKTIRYKLQSTDQGVYELLVRSALANIATRNGWIHTGDLAILDENELLVWCGRKDDMIISNGVNIYPVEIEKQLLDIPGIEEVLVTKEQHGIKGENIVAFITLLPGKQISPEEIKAELRTVIAGIKIPGRINIIQAFEYSPSGKKRKPVSQNTGL